MNFQAITPPEVLKPFVRFIWTLESDSADNSTFAPIADGCPGIIFQRSEKGTFHDERSQQLPGIFLYGQTTTPEKMHLTGKVSTVGIILNPHALKSVFGFDADELTSSCTDLDFIGNKKASRLSEQLLNAASTAEQVDILSSYLFAQIQKNRNLTDDTMLHAVNQIIQSGGGVTLKELQAKLQVTERTFERRFKQSIGISPKLFGRICRFQVSLKQLRKNDYDKLSDIAYENGYADQSHFIRTFKEFAGFSPYTFKKQSNELVQNFPLLTK